MSENDLNNQDDHGPTSLVSGDALTLYLKASAMINDAHALRAMSENMLHNARALKVLAYKLDPKLEPAILGPAA